MSKLKKVLISVFALLSITGVVTTSVLYFNEKKDKHLINTNKKHKIVFEGVANEEISEFEIYENNLLNSKKVPKALEKQGQFFFGWKEKNSTEFFNFKSEITKPVVLVAVYESKEVYENAYTKLSDSEKKYTESSIEVLKKAFEKFKNIIENKKSSGKERQDSYQALTKAYNELKLKQPETPVEKVSVEFNLDGGQLENSTVEVNKGSKVTRPVNPTKQHYTFVGWFANSEKTEEFNFENPINSNTTIYAKYASVSYTLTFNANGGELAEGVENQAQVEYNTSYPTAPELKERQGYKFVQWEYSKDDQMHKFEFGTTLVENNLELVAKWERTEFNVTFILNDGDETKNVVKKVQIVEGIEPKATQLTNEEISAGGVDSVFEKWVLSTEDKDANAYDFNTVLTNDLTLKAIYKEVTALSSFYMLEDQAQVLVEGQIIYTFSDPSHQAADFYIISSQDGTAANYIFLQGDEFKQLTSDVTVNEHNRVKLLVTVSKNEQTGYGLLFNKGNFIKFYNENLPKVTYRTLEDIQVEDTKSYSLVNLNNVKYLRKQTIGENQDQKELLIFSLNDVEIYIDPSFQQQKEYEEGKMYSFTNVFLYGKEDDKLYLMLLTDSQINESFKVTFDLDGGVLENNVVKVNKGEKVQRPTTNPTKQHYTFDNWYNSETKDQVFNFETVISQNTTIYAKWTPVQYTLTFNANGGELAENQASSVQVTYNTSHSTQPNVKERQGYKLVEWQYEKDGQMHKFEFGTTLVEDNLTLKALWKRSQLTVTYILKEGDSSKNKTRTVDIQEGTETKASDLSKDEKTYDGIESVFDKWVLENQDKNAEAYNFDTPITENLTLKAIYKEVTALENYYNLKDQDKVLIEGQIIYTIKSEQEPDTPHVYVISSSDGFAANFIFLKGDDFKELTTTHQVDSTNKVRLYVTVEKNNQGEGFSFTKGDFIKFYTETLSEVQFSTVDTTEIEDTKLYRIVNVNNLEYLRKEQDKGLVFSFNNQEVYVDGIEETDFVVNKLYNFTKVFLYGKVDEKLYFYFMPVSTKEAVLASEFSVSQEGEATITLNEEKVIIVNQTPEKTTDREVTFAIKDNKEGFELREVDPQDKNKRKLVYTQKSEEENVTVVVTINGNSKELTFTINNPEQPVDNNNADGGTTGDNSNGTNTGDTNSGDTGSDNGSDNGSQGGGEEQPVSNVMYDTMTFETSGIGVQYKSGVIKLSNESGDSIDVSYTRGHVDKNRFEIAAQRHNPSEIVIPINKEDAISKLLLDIKFTPTNNENVSVSFYENENENPTYVNNTTINAKIEGLVPIELPTEYQKKYKKIVIKIEINNQSPTSKNRLKIIFNSIKIERKVN